MTNSVSITDALCVQIIALYLIHLTCVNGKIGVRVMLNEKIVKGLACCINAETLCGSYCPYYKKGTKESGCETLLMSDALIELSKKDVKNNHIKQLLLDKIFPFKGVDMKSYSINAYAVYVAINNILGGD